MDAARELGEAGLSEALERLRGRLSLDASYQIPFTEALWWVVSLKDTQKDQIACATTEGRTLRALAFARNYASHELVTLGKLDLLRSGFTGAGATGFGMTGTGGVLVWVDESTLPPNDCERKNPGKTDSRRSIYQDLVAGRSVLYPLELAQNYLKGLP